MEERRTDVNFKFKLKDLYNGDVVGYFDTVQKLRKAQQDYDDLCEGDWIPEIRIFNPKTGKYRLANISETEAISAE